MKKYDINQPVNLKSGVYHLNDERNFDYQLNRVINWDGGRIEDVQKIASKIHNSEDWKRELIRLGDAEMSVADVQKDVFSRDAGDSDLVFLDPEEGVRHVRSPFRSVSDGPPSPLSGLARRTIFSFRGFFGPPAFFSAAR